MILSVIIVSYNVKYFLEQSLHSVLRASAGHETEVWVIDNNSGDETIGYLRPKFPGVQFIANTTNQGFSRACNQGLAMATGDYILFLNPDTILPENSFSTCIDFMGSNPKAGAIGIRMLDGAGRFLKESKRAFPSPITSLFKLTGLSRLFPRSAFFSRYHLGHLDENSDHVVDVLSGAFMFIRKEVLDITGGFDETFFMYGEDIDLSYRIQQAGYLNYYLSGSPIIHFKGESTRKSSANYVRMFYQAMSIFVRKHYGKNRAGFFNASIQLAITGRAVLSALSGFLRRIGMPLIDASLIIGSFWMVKILWNKYVKTGTVYDTRVVWISFAVLTAIYLVIAYYAGLYDRWYKKKTLWITALTGSLAVLAVYSLLPESLRFSRGVILFGTVAAFILIALIRNIFLDWGIIKLNESPASGFALIIGSPKETGEAAALLKHSEAGRQLTILESSPGMDIEYPEKKLAQIIRDSPSATRELVFCIGDLTAADVIGGMHRARPRTSIRIHYSGSSSMVGSNSSRRSGDALATGDQFRLALPFHRRLKRLADLSTALVFILFFPLHFALVKKPARFLLNCLAVLGGKKTWIGYTGDHTSLPPLKPGVISPDGKPANASETGPAYTSAVNQNYARQFDPADDLRLIMQSYRKLGG